MIEAKNPAVVRAGAAGWRGLSAERRREALWGIALASPAILGFLIWQLGPMIASLLMVGLIPLTLFWLLRYGSREQTAEPPQSG